MKTNRRFLLAAIFRFAIIFTFSCSGSDDDNVGDNSGGSTTAGGAGGSCDIDDYRANKIGDQIWMAENLNCDVAGSRCYGEGGSVLDISTGKIIRITLSNAEIKANCAKYGRLYDWEMAMKACPSGWHLPSYDEWTTLIDFVGGSSATKLKATSGWSYTFQGETKYGNGTDDYGFSALPSGLGDPPGGDFSGAGYQGRWWTSTETELSTNSTYVMGMMRNDNDEVFVSPPGYKSYLYSVRCVKD